jgi:hypothetical protein
MTNRESAPNKDFHTTLYPFGHFRRPKVQFFAASLLPSLLNFFPFTIHPLFIALFSVLSFSSSYLLIYFISRVERRFRSRETCFFSPSLVKPCKQQSRQGFFLGVLEKGFDRSLTQHTMAFSTNGYAPRDSNGGGYRYVSTSLILQFSHFSFTVRSNQQRQLWGFCSLEFSVVDC